VSLPRALLLLLVPIYGIYLLSPAVGYMHDDGLYLITSRALAAGRGYIIESLPSELPQTKYPILYPAILALFWKVAGSIGPVAFIAKLLSLACTIAWLAIVRKWAAKVFENPLTVDWVLFFSACSPWVVFLSTSALPDTFFALLSTISALMLLGDKHGNADYGWRSVAMAAALAAAAFLLRTTGIALIAAAAIVLLKRNPRHTFLFLFVVALLSAPWLYWQALHAAPTDVIQLYYSKASYARGHILAGYQPLQMLNVLVSNTMLIGSTFVAGIQVLPLALSMPIGMAGLWYVGKGWFFGSMPRFSLIAVWVVLYSGILLCWVWPPQRYMTPIVPVLLIYLAQALSKLGWIQTRQLAAPCALIACSIAAIAAVGAGAIKTIQVGSPMIGWIEGERWSEHQEIAAWIEANTSANSVVSANLDPLLYLYSGRKAIRAFRHSPYDTFYADPEFAVPVGTAEDIRQQMKSNGVTHVVLTPMKGFPEGKPFQKVFAELQARRPAAIRLIKQLSRSGYAIYQINQQAL